MVKALASTTGGLGLISGQGTKISKMPKQQEEQEQVRN